MTCSPRLKPGDSCFFNGCLLALGARRSHSISTGLDGQPDRTYDLGRIDVPVVDGAAFGAHPFPDVQRLRGRELHLVRQPDGLAVFLGEDDASAANVSQRRAA